MLGAIGLHAARADPSGTRRIGGCPARAWSMNFGYGKFERGHELLELCERLAAAEPRVAPLLLGDRRYAAIIVVVCGIDERCRRAA